MKNIIIYGTELKKLPESIGNLHNLDFLTLVDNSLEELPQTIGNLTNLKVLQVIDANIKLSAEIGTLSGLSQLYLKKINAKTLPPEIGNLKNLKVLDIDSDSLTNLPNEITRLKKLKLFASRCNAFLPTEMEKLTTLTKLEDLTYWGSMRTTLPEGIGRMKNLKVLDMSGSRLNLSTELKKLKALENLIFLRLVDNNITIVPDEIAELKTLSKLYKIDFNCNPITEISPAIAQLNSLNNLRIEENQLTELPPEIFDMPNLTMIHIKNSNLPTYWKTSGGWAEMPDDKGANPQCDTQYRNFLKYW